MMGRPRRISSKIFAGKMRSAPGTSSSMQSVVWLAASSWSTSSWRNVARALDAERLGPVERVELGVDDAAHEADAQRARDAPGSAGAEGGPRRAARARS